MVKLKPQILKNINLFVLRSSQSAMKTFYQFVNEKRTEKEMSLRQFCKLAGLDPSNWSKVERGIAKQSHTKKILERISNALELNEKERESLTDLAILDSIPAAILPDSKIRESLPLFLRTLRGDKLKVEELNLLFQIIQKANQASC